MTNEDRFCVPDLKKERANCSFDKDEITYLLDGGKKQTKLRHSLEELVFSDPELLDDIPPEYLSYEERYSNELRKLCRVLHLINNNERMQQLANREQRLRLILNSDIGNAINKDGNPFSLHFSMFHLALLGQGSPEQQSYWLAKIKGGEVVGTYAQTELGHGTYLKGLETTATFDPSTDEFVLNSPTRTSFKFWPGGLGKTANHAVVMAQLYAKGKCYGPHIFIVQLRDKDTHRSLPGITVGEIGPRLGLNTNDNGFLGFNNYRIPRENMLMKHAQVCKDGSYSHPLSQKLSYGTMLLSRIAICKSAAGYLAKAVTIATRYSAVRRQSKILPDELEPQILDYQTQQFKLIPMIASVFALKFAAENLRDTWQKVTQDIDQGNLALLPELHALSCGLKAQSTFDSTYGVDSCRLACGGNGYIVSSNFARIFSIATAAITYEGENTVMLLQTARYIMKAYKQNKMARWVEKRPLQSDFSNEGLLQKWDISVAFLLNEVSARIDKLTSRGVKYEFAWNACTISLVKIAQAHIRHFICDQFIKKLKAISVSPPTQTILGRLCRLYLLYHVGLDQGLLLRSGSLSSEDLSVLENEMLELLTVLRKDAVNIVDSFDFHDRVLNSTLGCWDGNVYERLYEASLLSPMNKKDVVDAIPKYLQPLKKSQL